MITVKVVVMSRPPLYPIRIGRRGENEVTKVIFDVSYLVKNYGDGAGVLMFKRKGDSTAYPVSVERSGNEITWIINDTDSASAGDGECELFWFVNEALAKTVVYMTVTAKDIGETTETAPEAFETWVDTLTALGAETLQNAQDAALDASAAAGSAGTAEEKAMAASGYALEAKTWAERAEDAAASITGYSFTDDGEGNITITI